jgi:hypothetical protein
MSKTINRYALTFLGLMVISFVGCSGDGYKLAPVSGIVTVDGQPTADIYVMFSPLPSGDSSIVGPFSSAVTNAAGEFTLKTKQGKSGAVVCFHSVSCQYSDYNPEGTSDLEQAIQEAEATGEDSSALRAKLKTYTSKKSIPSKYGDMKIEVPSSGLTDYKIEIVTK